MSANPDQRAAAVAADGSVSAACMLCGGRRIVPHFRSTASPLPTSPVSERYRITHSERRLVHRLVRCADCGMVTLPLHCAPAASYEEAADPYYIEQAAQRIRNAHHLLDLIPAGGRLLEIGCACGFLLHAARERGFTVQGVEMSAWASAYARDTFGLDVVTGSVDNAGLPADRFDAVVMADVIEHLFDPRETIRQIHRVLRPGGRVLVLTPDIGSVMARVFGPRWWGLLDDHYFYFSRRTLRRLFESEGFTVRRIAALGRLFPLSHWAFKLVPYSRALHAIADRSVRALHIENVQISINLGDQMACVAQKR